MTEHAERFPPSHAEVWFNCSGSPWMEEQVEVQLGSKESSDAAREGTAAHELFDWCAKNDKRPGAYPDTHIIVEGHSYPVDAEMRHGVQMMLDWYYERRLEHAAPGAFTELRVDMGPVLGTDDCFGTCDALMMSADGKVLHAGDLKYGKGVIVEAADNLQLILYLIGGREHFERDFEEYRGTIVQPRRYDGGPKITTAVYTHAELLEWIERFKAAVYAVQHGDFTLSPSDDACRWCRAKAICPALARKTMNDAAVIFGDLPQTGEEIFQAVSQSTAEGQRKIDTLTLDQIKGLLGAGDLIRGFLSAVDDYALALWLAGKGDDDYKVVEGMSKRKFKDEENASARLRSKTFGLKMDQVMRRSLRSPAQIEKLLKAGDGAEMNERRWDIFNALIVKPPGKNSLVPASNKKPAIKTDAVSVFTETPLPEEFQSPPTPDTTTKPDHDEFMLD